jgi:hypothetical protein
LASLDEFRARGIWQEKKASDWIGEHIVKKNRLHWCCIPVQFWCRIY